MARSLWGLCALAAIVGCAVVPTPLPGVAPIAGSSNVVVGPLVPGGLPVVINPVAAPALVPGGILIGAPTLDGAWVIQETDGTRHCLTIQEGRVSILILGCRADGTGSAASVVEAPRAAVAGPTVVLTATVVPRLFSTERSRLTFSGTLQPDGTYVGALQIIDEAAADEAIDDRPAVLARS